jgi:hypothetical protein
MITALGDLGCKSKSILFVLTELMARDRDTYLRREAAQVLGILGCKSKPIIDSLIRVSFKETDKLVR